MPETQLYSNEEFGKLLEDCHAELTVAEVRKVFGLNAQTLLSFKHLQVVVLQREAVRARLKELEILDTTDNTDDRSTVITKQRPVDPLPLPKNPIPGAPPTIGELITEMMLKHKRESDEAHLSPGTPKKP